MPKHSGSSPKKSGGAKKAFIIFLIVVGVFFAWRNFFSGLNANNKLSTSQFTQAVEAGAVKDVTYDPTTLNIEGIIVGSNQLGSTIEKPFISSWAGYDSFNEFMAKYPDVNYQIKANDGLSTADMISVASAGFTVFLIVLFVKNMKSMNPGMNKKQMKQAEHPKVTFKDVAGIDEAVEELEEIKDFLVHPEEYRKMGAKIPRGALLVGPPGTGKTLLAKAIAGEAKVPFFSVSGSEFLELYVGVGASRVRDLFKAANEASPAIIFIDEIDAIGRQRGTGVGGGHDEREQTLNQILVEMDGFGEQSSVILLAATNRPDVLDPALLRPGRFDRRITVGSPDVKGREQILKVHAANKTFDEDINFETIAKLTPGFTGADLANLMNESALLAVRAKKKSISMIEIEEAMERSIAGPQLKNRVMTESERVTIAYHESGHALIGHMLPNADPVHKITIVGRGQALGYTLSLPEEDHFLQSRKSLIDEIVVFLGGRTAEELFCDDITTGASNDLERATRIARRIVTEFGMDDALGARVFGEPQHEVFLGRDYAHSQDYSDATALAIDNAVSKLMNDSHERATQILTEYRERIDLMAKVLLVKESVEGEELKALLDGCWTEEEFGLSQKSDSEVEEKSTEVSDAADKAEEGSSVEDASAADVEVAEQQEALQEDSESSDTTKASE